MENSEEIKVKKVKKTMTEKQKAARMLNLANGRKKRMEMLKQKQESKSNTYDIESENDSDSDSSSSGDESDFVISKKKKTIKPKKVAFNEVIEKKHKVSKSATESGLKKEMDELKNMMFMLATEQKKTKKAAKKQTKRSGGTKLVILPQANAPNNPQSNKSNDSQMDALRRSLGM